jgi:hypothetical protein
MPNPSTPLLATSERADRWLPFLVISLVFNLGSAFLFPLFVTDG